MIPFLSENYYFPGNFVGPGTQAQKYINTFKRTIANSLNADPSEIHLTSGGTIANNIGIKGFILANAHKGNHLICSEIDYPDILTNVAFFEENGFTVTYLKANFDGMIDLAELKNAINKETILVMTTLANHVLGTIQPIMKIKEIIKEKNIETALFVDAGHAYGRMKIDVKAFDCEMLSFSGHKIHGPQGTGSLYIKKGVKINQYLHGISRIDDLNTGGISMAALAGLSKAVEIQFADLEKNIDTMKSMRLRLLDGIRKNIDNVSINGPIDDNRICHNLNISVPFIEGEGLMLMLDIANISVATGSACASQGLKPNYILMATGRTFLQSHGSIKLTLSRMTTEDEIEYVIEKFTEAVKKLKKLSPLSQDSK